MGTDTIRPVHELTPISRTTDAREMALAAYTPLLGLLEDLEPEEWHAPTECPGWDVAAMVGHLIGAGKACASMREGLRQQLWGARHADDFGGNSLDAANELQVRDHQHLSPTERVAALRAIAPAAVRGRMRLPGPLRSLRVPLAPGGSTAPGMPVRLSLGHLMDVIYTRDVWLHTIDIARATARPLRLTAGVEGRLVEDVVREWAGRHGRPFVLTLSGPAGGRFCHGDGGGHLGLDAIEFCRILSGRADAAEAGDVGDRAETTELLATRVVF